MIRSNPFPKTPKRRFAMKRKLLFVVAILVVMCASLVLSTTTYAQTPTANTVTIEVTVSDTGDVTVGSMSLRGLGMGQLSQQVVQISKTLNSAHLVLQGEFVNVDVNGTPVLKIQWTKASRQLAADLAARYGYPVAPDVLARVEEWISSSTVDVTAKYSNANSKPLAINLTKSILVDVGPQGQVAIEKGPLAYGIDPSVLATINQGGAKNTTLCWNKGTLSAKVDGKDLPSITVDPNGLKFLSKALNLNIENSVDPFFTSMLGVDVSLAGGQHQTVGACSK
jgi:hypothetical protein